MQFALDNVGKQMVGDLLSDKPIDPKNGPPAVVKDAPNTDFLEMDLHLAVINGQKRSSWIVEPADGKQPASCSPHKPTGRVVASQWCEIRSSFSSPL